MPPSDDADFASVAEALYAVPASGFVAERNARAKQARADGDRDLAARITALPKPSAAAWLVNLLVREGDDDLEHLLGLGAELRAAQEEGDGAQLRDLGTRRRDLLADLTRITAERAERADRKPSASVLEEFQQTLQAVLIDEGAAAAVQTGRLVHALSADGLDPADLTDAVGGPGAIARSRPKRAAPRSGAERDSADDARAAERSRQREEAERRAAEATDRADDARRAADDAAARLRDAEEAVAQHDASVRAVETRLEEVRRELESAQQALADAEDEADGSRSAEEDAARTADDAEAEAAGLRDALER